MLARVGFERTLGFLDFIHAQLWNGGTLRSKQGLSGLSCTQCSIRCVVLCCVRLGIDLLEAIVGLPCFV